MAGPELGSILLGSTDPARLRSWYEKAFDVSADAVGFLHFGEMGVLIDGRDDIAGSAVEGSRVILNFHVDDAKATAAHLTALGATWLVEVEFRSNGWFGTLQDPDGNTIQIIEFTEAYRAARGR